MADDTKTIQFEGTKHKFPKDFTDEDIQKALSSYAPPAKTSGKTESTSTGVVVPKGAISPKQDPNSISGGIKERIKAVPGGIKETFRPSTSTYGKAADTLFPPLTPVKRMIGGQIDASKKALQQAGAQYGRGETTRSIFTGASALNPFATSSVVDINEDIDAGRTKTAIGKGAFDVVTLGLGSRLFSKAKLPENVLAATTGGDVNSLKTLMPKLVEHGEKFGQPRTIGDFNKMIGDTSFELEKEFQRDMQPVAQVSRWVNTQELEDRLRRGMIKPGTVLDDPKRYVAMRDTVNSANKARTLEEMNNERARIRAEISNYYDKNITDQARIIKNDDELAAKKIYADYLADTVNKEVSRVTGKPVSYYENLRRQQEAAFDLRKFYDDQIAKLEQKQAVKEGSSTFSKVRPQIYTSMEGVPRVHITGFPSPLEEGALKTADKGVRRAFRSTPGQKLLYGSTKVQQSAQAELLAMPVERLLDVEKKKKGRLLPPPKAANE